MNQQAIAANLAGVLARIRDAECRYGRPAGSVDLVAVSKLHPAEAIRAAFAAGQRAFGENYVQEALAKQAALSDLPIEWHFIGPLQSNKTRAIAEHFHWLHSLEREKVAQRLSQQRPAHLPPLNVCIQVNVSGEASKRGVPPAEALPLARSVAALPNLRLRGFMAIPEPTPDLALLRARFREVALLLEQARHSNLPMDTLSMGMSADLEAAIMEGATMVRVGTAIFGARDYNTNQEQSS